MNGFGVGFIALTAVWFWGCTSQPSVAGHVDNPPVSIPDTSIQPPAPLASTTDGFDGSRAFEHVRHLVELGPRPPGSDAIHQAQSYIVAQLKSYGCQVEEHGFHASTAIGDLQMKNIVAKIPGTEPGIVLFATHFDTVRLPNFVGADDGGSGTGTMLELARVLCSRKSKLNTWIVFFDGEEPRGSGLTRTVFSGQRRTTLLAAVRWPQAWHSPENLRMSKG